jgi:putative transposase
MAEGSIQLELRPRAWGGKRLGAGRKPSGRKVGVPHRTRPAHHARHPLHVTLRARHGLPSLRADTMFPVIQRGIAKGSRGGIRILEFSVQHDHVHLLVEAVDAPNLSRGLQGLAIRIAKGINRILGRRGRVWSDRFHARALRTPREVRNALVYVLQNWRKHVPGARGMDSRSSGGWFTGWRTRVPRLLASSPVVPPRTWLAAIGWRRLGLIHPDEGPALHRRP